MREEIKNVKILGKTERHENSVMLNNHVMVNPTHVIPHVILNLFQDLSLIKSLNRQDTKPKSISTTMVNNKSLPALEQIQYRIDKMLKQVQHDK